MTRRGNLAGFFIGNVMSRYYLSAIDDNIEITEEMVEAGCLEMPLTDCTRYEERETVIAVFRAMLKAGGFVCLDADLMMEQ